MLLPLFVAVGITTMVDFTKKCAIIVYGLFLWQMSLPYGCCYCHILCFVFLLLADVIAMWLMFCHYYVLFLLADVIAMWLVLLPLVCSGVWLMLLPWLGV